MNKFACFSGVLAALLVSNIALADELSSFNPLNMKTDENPPITSDDNLLPSADNIINQQTVKIPNDKIKLVFNNKTQTQFDFKQCRQWEGLWGSATNTQFISKIKGQVNTAHDTSNLQSMVGKDTGFGVNINCYYKAATRKGSYLHFTTETCSVNNNSGFTVGSNKGPYVCQTQTDVKDNITTVTYTIESAKTAAKKAQPTATQAKHHKTINKTATSHAVKTTHRVSVRHSTPTQHTTTTQHTLATQASHPTSATVPAVDHTKQQPTATTKATTKVVGAGSIS